MIRRASSRGSVLVAVLVMIAFAVLLLTRLIESGSADLLLAMHQVDRDRLRADAQGALETTLAVLAEFRTVDGGLYAPTQGWSKPLDYADYVPRAGVSLEVGFEDESGKLSLPVVSAETLRKWFKEQGLAAADADRVTDAMFAWMRPGYTGSDATTRPEAYAGRAQSLVPPLRSPRSFEELATIAVAGEFFYEPDGSPKPLLEKFRQSVSLYQFSATNLNAAGVEVLTASGWNATQVSGLKKRRDGSEGSKAKSYFHNAQEAGGAGGGLGATIQLLRINVTARQGAARLRLSALVTWDRQAVLPPPILSKSVQAARAPAKPAAVTSKDVDLHYPFTILEISGSTSPEPAPEHEPAA